MDGWLRISAAAIYAGNVSERTVREWIKRKGLRYARVGGLILIKVEWLDEFLAGFENSTGLADRIAEEVIAEVRK